MFAAGMMLTQCFGRKRRFVNEDPVTGETSDNIVTRIDATPAR